MGDFEQVLFIIFFILPLRQKIVEDYIIQSFNNPSKDTCL